MDWLTGLVNARQVAIQVPSASPDHLAFGINRDSFSFLAAEGTPRHDSQGTVTITPVQAFELRRR